MSAFLEPEPETDADAAFRNFMRHNLGMAVEHFGLTVSTPPVFGWRLKSIGAEASGVDGARWLRVVSQEPQWAFGEHWTGTVDAGAIVGIRKPRVLSTFEWTEQDWRHQRAEVMTLLSGELCSPTDVLHEPLDVPADWWPRLRSMSDTLTTVETNRVYADRERVTEQIRARFGDVDTTVHEWTTVHGDLHWANLLRPEFGVLDWELWGRGPVGIDAATLLCFSLLAPKTVELIREVFADQLDTPTGLVAQRYVAARLLRRIDDGDFPELAGPLRDYVPDLDS